MAWSKNKKSAVFGVVLLLAAGIITVSKQMVLDVPFQQHGIMRMQEARQLALAFIMFADTHGNQLPGNFTQAGTPPDLSETNWEIVFAGNLTNTSPSQTILLREKEARKSPRGEFVRAYAFADGHAELVRSADDDFQALEKKRGFVGQPAAR